MKRVVGLIAMSAAGALPLVVGFVVIFISMPGQDGTEARFSGAAVLGFLLAVAAVVGVLALARRRGPRGSAATWVRGVFLAFAAGAVLMALPFVGMDIALSHADPAGVDQPRPGAPVVVGVIAAGLVSWRALGRAPAARSGAGRSVSPSGAHPGSRSLV